MNLTEKYRNQRDVLAESLVAIVNADADGKGFFAKMALEGLQRMALTDDKNSQFLDRELAAEIVRHV